MPIIETYIRYGVPSDWASRYEHIRISTETFKHTSKKNLNSKYKIPVQEIDFVKNCLARKPIDENTILRLLENSNFVCCLCKGIKSHAYIIHHIVEYSKSQDNSYDNLAVICPSDHDLAHRTGVSLTNKISEKQIRTAKKSWEKKVQKENKEKALNKSIKVKTQDWKKTNPYKELQSYSERDKEFFFGRKLEIQELVARIYKYNIVGLFGESGTGKTSLINAGLIPNFKNENFITVSVRCLDEPIKRIREELLKVLREINIGDQLIENLAATDSFSRLIVQLKLLANKQNITFIIVVDQFEEIFTRSRESERENLSKGIIESLVVSSTQGRIYFLLSLREDYIGELWDWAHLYNLEDAWINQYRIKRFSEKMAYDAIVEPLHKLGIKTEDKFILQLITELKNIGDGLIYPPYLQIACSELFEEYKSKNLTPQQLNEFGYDLLGETDNVESIIANYLSESMLEGLTDEEKNYAQNILDLLTGPEGLRTFLNVEEISRHIAIKQTNTQHVIEHLIKKKIVHPVLEEDKVIGYELVHDFLSKRFFEKLGPEAKRAKTMIEIFRKEFRDWKQHGVLVSKDRLEILFPHVHQLALDDEGWAFLIKSSFFVYWNYENKWTAVIDQTKLTSICLNLLSDSQERIVENAITTLGKTKNRELTPRLIKIITSPELPITVRDTALNQFWYQIMDLRIIDILRDIIINEKANKLRKTAVYAFGRHLNEFGKSDTSLIDKEINVLFHALNDRMTEVRKQAADVLGFNLLSEVSLQPLIKRLKIEYSISSRKAIVLVLASFLRKGNHVELIHPILQEISLDENEDYRVRQEARYGINSLLNKNY